MNSRRLIAFPEARTTQRIALHQRERIKLLLSDGAVRFGPKADIQDGYDRSSRNAIAAMLNMRVRGRFTDSDLVY
jgi:hypothetical protein